MGIVILAQVNFMYCVGCGSTLPNEARFCPRCGKRSVLYETISDPDLPKAPANTEINTNGNSKALEPELSPQTETSTNVVVQTVFAESAAGTSKVAKKYVNAGSITLGVVALICLILGAIQGFIPIFLIEGIAFGALAWLCAARWPLSPRAFSAVSVTSLLLAGLVGVTLDQDTFGRRYRYLSQGSTQYRVDEKAGRTDRLGSGGWYPVAFDKNAQEVPGVINLDKGNWSYASEQPGQRDEDGFLIPGGGRVCFEATNSSGYIVDRISIKVQIRGKDGEHSSDPYAKYINGPVVNESIIVLRNNGFINAAETSEVCGSFPRALAEGESWSYTDMHVYGWKR